MEDWMIGLLGILGVFVLACAAVAFTLALDTFLHWWDKRGRQG